MLLAIVSLGRANPMYNLCCPGWFLTSDEDLDGFLHGNLGGGCLESKGYCMFMFRLVTILFAQLCLGGVRVASLCDGRLCHVQLILTYNISCVSLSDHMKLSTKCWLEVLLFVLSLVLSSSLVFSSFRSIYLNIWLLNFLHCLLGCCQDLEVARITRNQ